MIHYKNDIPEEMKSKTAWLKAGRKVLEGQTPVATAAAQNRKYDLYHINQTFGKLSEAEKKWFCRLPV